MLADPIRPPPECPTCGRPMRLDRVTPRAFGHPELRTYLCAACLDATTLAEPEPEPEPDDE